MPQSETAETIEQHRRKLPPRRQNETHEIEHRGHAFTITIGFDDDGSPLEVFAGSAKIGTDIAHLVADACVLISVALQYGCPPGDLPKSLGRVPDLYATEENATTPASVVGVIADAVSQAVAPWQA